MEAVFTRLGFSLYKGKSHIDRTEKEIKGLVEEFAQDPINQHSRAVVVIIMSHGTNEGKIYGSDNE